MPSEKNRFRFTIRGKTYTILFVSPKKLKGSRGDCDSPKYKKPVIRIANDLGEKLELEILVHEILHACFFDLDEEPVTQAAKDISKILRNFGYKKEK